MANPFKGMINVDIRDSVPDWSPFEPPKAPDGAPNVVYIVLDDVGFSAMGCYGGPIETPNIDRIATDGVRYTQWHTTALCSPTRSCLLTGRNHTRNSMACITEAAIGFPNASGTIPPENGMLPEILGERGWNTYMVGKWHLCPTDEMNLASTRRNWPTGRGFERFYGFLGAETNQWYPDLVYDNHPVDQPRTPEEGYHLTEDLTDKALEFIKDAKAIAPDKPFFLYYAPGACHAPHHAPKEWIDRFKGRFDMGYEAMREQTLARQKELGIVPADTELPAAQPDRHAARRAPARTGKPFPRARLHAAVGLAVRRRAAAVLPHGRGLRGLPGARRPPDRPAARLPRGDRPAREHDGRPGLRQRRQRRGRPERLGQREQVRSTASPTTSSENLAMIDELGGPKTYNHYPNGWAMAFNTPFKMWKRYEFNGGTLRPVHHLLAEGHRGARARSATSTTTRSTSSRRSSTASASSRRRRSRGTRRAASTASACATASTTPRCPTARATQFYSMLGSRAIWHDGWKAVTHAPDDQRLGPLQRRHVGALPHRRRPLRAARPRRRAAGEAARAGQPVVRRGRRQRRVPARRPLRAGDPHHAAAAAHRPRDRYRYYPDVADVPESQAVNIRNRSYVVGAVVDIPGPGAQGVLFAHGSRFGGHALYVKDNRLHYVYNFVGMPRAEGRRRPRTCRPART